MLRFLLPLALLPAATALAVEPPSATFTVKTLPAQMRYDVTEMMVKPGASVKIIFENQDAMPHNMVFFQPDTDVVAVSNSQMEKPEEALKRNWLPEDPRVWQHSKLLNPQEKEELVFHAPEKPGTYPFVCTMPGHAVTMQGRLKVFAPGPQLTGLKFALYLGDWQKLPNFAALTPHRTGDVPDNLLQLKFDDYKNQYGVVFTGQIQAPKDDEYTFAIAGDDGVRLLIDGKKIVEDDGVHPAKVKEAKAKLKAGPHNVRVEYFQQGEDAQIFAAWQGADFAMTPLSLWVPAGWKEGAPTKKTDRNTGLPLVVEKEPVIYRNFIEGAGNRGIGVGYPGRMNIAWSAENMNLALIWRGAFIDAARHWRDRGGGAQPPLGYDVFKADADFAPPLAVLASMSDEWPKLSNGERAPGFQWKGYLLDAQRYPTFLYTWQGLKVSDRFDAHGEATSGTGRLVRTVKLLGSIPPNATFRAASGSIKALGNDSYSVEAGAKITLSVEGATLAGSHLLVPARPEIKITYAWPEMHQHTH